MSKSSGSSGVVGCVFLLASPIISVFSAFYHAWAATILWSWFIAPHEHIAAPPYAVLVGASYIFALYHTGSSNDDIKDEYRESADIRAVAAISKVLFVPIALLGFAWIVHQFIK